MTSDVFPERALKSNLRYEHEIQLTQDQPPAIAWHVRCSVPGIASAWMPYASNDFEGGERLPSRAEAEAAARESVLASGHSTSSLDVLRSLPEGQVFMVKGRLHTASDAKQSDEYVDDNHLADETGFIDHSGVAESHLPGHAFTHDGAGYVFDSPEAGVQYRRQHPVESGENPRASGIRRSTALEDQMADRIMEDHARFAELTAESARLAREIDGLKSVIEAMNGVSFHQTDRPFRELFTGTGIRHHFHPLTCGNDSSHTPLFPHFAEGRVKLICRDCDFTQDNAGPLGFALTETQLRFEEIEGGWLPILSAPKDGRLIQLTWFESGRPTEIWTMRWGHIQQNGLFPGQVGMWVAPDGSATWQVEDDLGPTHWRPCPPSSQPETAHELADEDAT